MADLPGDISASSEKSVQRLAQLADGAGDPGQLDGGDVTSPKADCNGAPKSSALESGAAASAGTDDGSSVPDEPSPSPQSRHRRSNETPPSSIGGGAAVLRRLESVLTKAASGVEVLDECQKEDFESKEESAAKKRRAALPKLNDISRAVITSYSLKAYTEVLAPRHRHAVANYLFNSTAEMLATLFRYPKCAVHVEDEGSYKSGISFAIQLALDRQFAKNQPSPASDGTNQGEVALNNSRGYKTLAQCQPVVYVSPAFRYDVQKYIAQQTGVEEVHVVSKFSGPLADIEGRLDHLALGNQIESDKSQGKTPLLVVAVVGSAVFGQNDLVSKLLQLRAEHGFWLHVIGVGLAAMASPTPSEHLVKVLQQVDSMSLALGAWLAVPPLGNVTLYRGTADDSSVTNPDAKNATDSQNVASIVGTKPSLADMSATLPYWVGLNAVTTAAVTKMMTQTISGLSRFENVQMMGVSEPTDYAAKMASGNVSVPFVLTFAYKPRNVDARKGDGPVDTEYVDSLNSWIGQGLVADCPNFGLQFIDLGADQSTAFRFCPMETAAALNTTAQHVADFMKHLEDVLTIVEATVRARVELTSILSEPDCARLRRVPVLKWAGAGAVSYLPSIVGDLSSNETDWSTQQKQQISHVNIELVHALRSADSAFSTGHSAIDGVACVKFGMLADERDLADLVKMVVQKGKQIEQSSKYLESLASLVRQGIEAASMDLQRENEQRLASEGVMRQLPMVGSLLNWWAPLPEEGLVAATFYKHRAGRVSESDNSDSRLQHNGMTPVTPVSTPQQPHQKIEEEVGGEEGGKEGQEQG